MRSAALGAPAELTQDTLDALTSDADSVGLLTLPPSYDASLRRYHLRRLAKLAAEYPTRTCAADAALDHWVGRPRCEGVPKFINRFAYANATVEVRARASSGAWVALRPCGVSRALPNSLCRIPHLAPSLRRWQLAALLATSLGLPPPPRLLAGVDGPGARQPTFQVLSRRAPRGSDWKVHAMDGQLRWEGIGAFARAHLRWDSDR
eukprot:7380991-Prymnesium_polylepis.2